MPGQVDGRVAIVTGGSSGNGRSIALALAEAGASAIVFADPREGGRPTVELLDEAGVRAVFVRCDVTRIADLESAVAAADEFGGLDILVNNAGIFSAGDFLGVTEEEFDRSMAINVKGAYFATQVAARSMIARGGGSVVNLGSVSAVGGAADYTLYCTTKGALRLLTQATAASLGPAGIRVNMVSPGLVKTAMTTTDVPFFGSGASAGASDSQPLDHIGTPEDIADAVVFLAGDQSRWVSGAMLVIDGGRTSTLPGAFSRARYEAA
jgi:NAD(P)-dependent dehydrogenase (short-subunit alcohol dehydrogenase family)